MSYNCASRTANVSRMRLDWDGGLANISAPSGNLDGSFNPDQTETDGSIPGTPFNPPVLPMPQSKGYGSNKPFGGTPGTNTGGKLSQVMQVTTHIDIDGGNGITGITIKDGSTAFDADKVSQGTTNKFATSTQLGKVDNLTITAATDLDTMRSDVAANNAKEGITQERADKLDAISYANGAISGFSFGSNTNVINAEAIETDVDRQFISGSQATDISNSKTKTDLISVSGGEITGFTMANAAISYEKIETDQDNQFIGAQLKSTIGTDAQARLVTDQIETQLINGSRKITSITTEDGDLDVNNVRDIEQATTTTEVNGTKAISFIQTTGSSVISTNAISDGSSSKKFTTTTERQHLSHLSSDSNGITLFTTSGGGGTNVNLFNVHNALLPSNTTCANTGVYAGTCSAIERATHLPDSSTDRTGQTGDKLLTIDASGDFNEVSDGNDGDMLTTNGSGVLTFAKVPGQGYHGSETRIKIGPSEFMGNDVGRTIVQTYIEDDTSSQLGLRTNQSSAEVFAFVNIPSGYKATHCHAYTSSAVTNGLKVHEYNTTTGALTNTTTGNTNTNVDITDITSSTTNMLVVAIKPGSTTNDVFGAHVTITAT